MDLKLRHLRKASDLTQGELANKLGTTLRVVSSWERGETMITLADAARVADVFECTLDELAGRSWPKPDYADPLQQAMNDAYESLPEDRKPAASAAVSGIAAQAAQEKTEVPRPASAPGVA